MLKLRSNRCKSTTDILNEALDEKENLCPGNSRANKSRSTEGLNTSGDKNGTPSKPHGFVKKLIASLEKRNDTCQANDEFWTLYCPTPGDDSYRAMQNESVGAETNDRRKTLDNFSQAGLKFSRLSNGDTRNEVTNGTDVRHREYNIDRNYFVARGSSLNRSLSVKGDVGRAISDDVKGAMIGSMTLDREPRKVSRRKSFRKFLGSMMKWGRSSSKGEPRRFLSCDDLIGDGTESKVPDFEELSKTLSLEANLDSDEKRREEFGRIARNGLEDPWTRNSSGSCRGDRARKKAAIDNKLTDLVDQKHVGSMDSLVKPSAIKDIARRLSQYQQQTRVLKH